MTVADLIVELRKQNPSDEVLIFVDSRDVKSPVESISRVERGPNDYPVGQRVTGHYVLLT